MIFHGSPLRRIGVGWPIAVLIGIAGQAQNARGEAQANQCLRVDLVNRQYIWVTFSKEPHPWRKENDLGNVGERELKRCYHNEGTWYAILRMKELEAPDHKAPRTVVDEASKAVPKSVWIATIRARALETVAAAEEALKLDSNHAPAHVALAAAWLKRGDAKKAQEILSNTKDIDRVIDGWVVRARTRLALGDGKGSLEAAKLIRASYFFSFETTPYDYHFREREELMGLAYLKLRKYKDAAQNLVKAATEGSPAALAALKDDNPPLAKALDKLKSHGKLSRKERAMLQTLRADPRQSP